MAPSPGAVCFMVTEGQLENNTCTGEVNEVKLVSEVFQKARSRELYTAEMVDLITTSFISYHF